MRKNTQKTCCIPQGWAGQLKRDNRYKNWYTTWLGVSDSKHIGVFHREILGIVQALHGVSHRGQNNASVENVLAGGHDGGGWLTGVKSAILLSLPEVVLGVFLVIQFLLSSLSAPLAGRDGGEVHTCNVCITCMGHGWYHPDPSHTPLYILWKSQDQANVTATFSLSNKQESFFSASTHK